MSYSTFYYKLFKINYVIIGEIILKFLWYLIEISATGLEIGLLMYVLIKKMGLQKWGKKYIVVCFWASIVGIITIFNNLTDQSFSSLYLCIILITLFYITLIKGPIIYKVFWSAFPLAIMCCIDYATIIFFTNVCGINTSAYAEQNTLRFFMIIFSKSIFTLFCFLVIKITTFKNIRVRLLYLIIPILSIVILSTFMIGEFSIVSNNNILFLFLTIVFLILNIAFFSFYDIINKINKEKYKKQMFNKQYELHISYYNKLDEIFTKLKQIRTEINEHLQVIWMLSRDPKIIDFEKYSIQIHGINEQLKSMNITGNNIVDVILYKKELLSSSKNIKLEIDNIDIPLKNISLKKEDLWFLFDNLLTYAIEYGIENSTIDISSKINNTNNCYEIKLLYSCIFENISKNKFWKKILHGKVYDMPEAYRNVVNMVEKYNGKIYRNDDKILILIPVVDIT